MTGYEETQKTDQRIKQALEFVASIQRLHRLFLLGVQQHPLLSPKQQPPSFPKQQPPLSPKQQPPLSPKQQPPFVPKQHPLLWPKQHPPSVPKQHPPLDPKQHSSRYSRFALMPWAGRYPSVSTEEPLVLAAEQAR